MKQINWYKVMLVTCYLSLATTLDDYKNPAAKYLMRPAFCFMAVMFLCRKDPESKDSTANQQRERGSE